jgi:hypothetical protein
MTSPLSLKQQLAQFSSMTELMQFFEIDCESRFLVEHGEALKKRFIGNTLIKKPQDWFAYRRCLKNAYCRIQRSLLPAGQRSACRGCTSCERR